jgi:hypothetical protein
MKPGGATALFLFDDDAAARAAVQGARDAAMDSIVGPILQPPADRRCSWEERSRKGSLIML